MALKKIDIDFEVLETGNPKSLIVCDTSEWAHIENEPSIIEIYMPNGKVAVYNHVKRNNTVFNTSNLLLSPIGQKNDLPDGIYKIVLKGSPDNYYKERTYIKTDKLQLDVDSMYTSLDIADIPENTRRTLEEVDMYIKASKASIRRDEKKKAVRSYKMAQSIFDEFSQCQDC